MRIRMVGATDIGRRRKTNQDSIYYDEPQGIGIVADGIGGRKGGGLASAMIVDGLKRAFLESDRIRHEEITPFVTSAIDRTNQAIIERGVIENESAGMGTTVNFLIFVGDRLHVAHVGDSRTYLFYRDHLWQLTIDHNIETFIARGWMPKSALHPNTKGSALVRSIGLSVRCEVEVYEIPLRSGQIYLTCSDGLTGMVDDRRIAALISANLQNFESLPKILIDEALRNGGKDNVTVLLSQVKEA